MIENDLMPTAPEAERGVLGAMIFHRHVIEEVSTIVTAADFYEPRNAWIFQAISDMHAEGIRAISPPMVDERLGDNSARCGGANYLFQLTSEASSTAAWDAAIVKNKAVRRRLIQAAFHVKQMAEGRSIKSEEIVESAVNELQAALGAPLDDLGSLTAAERFPAFMEEVMAGEDPDAIATPWPDLHGIVEFKPGQLVTVGAATGGGKSLFGLNVAAHVAALGKPALIASMEMSGNELMARLVASIASVPLNYLVNRNVPDQYLARIANAKDTIASLSNLTIDDQSNLTLSRLRMRIRSMEAAGKKPAVVVVDYLQLMTPENASGNRAQEVAALSRGLKLIAMEFGITVIQLAQFNRNSAGARPRMTDFKDSSGIEQDSNLVLILHRDLAEDGSDTGKRAGEIDLCIEKNRNGPAGVIITLAFQGHYARIKSMIGS